MENSIVERLFNWFDENAKEVQTQIDEPYLNSLVEVMETVFYEEAAEDLNDILQRKLNRALEELQGLKYTDEDMRKAVQLAILKGMRGKTQEQHLMTPESIGLIVGYLSDKLMKKQEEIRLFDPAGGTGNLLLTVMENLEQPKVAYASEIDPTLIELAVVRANLQKKEIEFFHQDSLAPFLLDPVDLVISDLPVGYYPDDVRAGQYELMADEGHAFAHHLFIEQSLKYTKEAGYLIFIIPDFLFESDQSEKLNRFLKEHAHIVGVLRLPETIFKSKQHVKSILILQKKAAGTSTPKQPLLVQMPDLNNPNSTADILSQMNEWFSTFNK